uniref:Major facilitator superfamily (MFS) profile domain-containing protein n=1 Tax=Globisporangium ultimum (strain ATCC 200006 / CBS 805.95 / DAOM BR144) TaxID=431595 RepID=K3W8F6_GLOUD
MSALLLQLTPRATDDVDATNAAHFLEAGTPRNECLSHASSLHIDHEPEIVDKYQLPVDPKQFDRATEIQPCNWLRPHMRIFHLSWMSAIPGFIGWYSIPPMMPVIKEQLHLTSGEVLNSDIAATASTIITRIAVGPMLDAYGPQFVQSWLLWIGAVPVACAAFVSNATGLLIVRFVIGFIGCIFVSSQYWTTITFAKNVVGTSNAITGGAGLAGIGFAFLVLPYVNLLLTSGDHISVDLGWRLTIALPAIAMVIMGTVIRFAVDPCPMGDFQHLVHAKREAAPGGGGVHSTSTTTGRPHPQAGMLQAFKVVLCDWNCLILILHYGISFGTELQLNNMGALYFYEEFLHPGCTDQNDDACHMLSKTQAATVASAFGLMNLWARALGGLSSDYANRKIGMKGRLYVQFTLLCIAGALVIVLSRTYDLGKCIALYVLIAISAQSAGGSAFGIVPYLNEAYTGTVTGLVGAGGNLGGVVFGIIFRVTATRQDGLLYLGLIVLVSSLSTSCLFFRNEKGREMR